MNLSYGTKLMGMDDMPPRPAVDAETGAGIHSGAFGREAAFGRARQHSRRVRRLKFIVPALAIALAVAFPLYSYIASPEIVKVETQSSAFSDGKLVMSNPKLEGFTKSLLPYAMTAVRAIQEAGAEGVIELEGIDARLPVSADNTVRVDAAKGTYDRTANTLTIDSEITLTTSDGMTAKLKSAFLDIDKGNMKTVEPVDISRPGTRITSDRLSVEDHGKVMIFEHRVRMNIDPAAGRGEQQRDEDNNATQ
ncbi:LPS export ABC transporter periplasmic protein LptC [Aquamicrobium segne]|uniref:LPS export ABC transporter periplasmic protein LptC n=1 Tax=Aquamicrobium segne TaxID=469547 RepID=A0ABW0H0I8_9HYPH